MVKFLKQFSVLCVEDDIDTLTFVTSILKKYFKEVYSAIDGEIGLQHYSKYQPDLIISDIQMPRIDGVRLVSNIRNNDTAIPIIILSGQQDKENLINLINLNVNAYIEKPLKVEELMTTITDIFFPKTTVFLDDEIILDIGQYKFIHKDINIDLKEKEMKFLNLLAKNKHTVTTYEQIEYTIWNDNIMTTNALKTFIKELRGKLPVDIIKNVSKVGYKLKLNT